MLLQDSLLGDLGCASDLGPLLGGQPGRTGTPDQRRETQVLRDPAGIRVG